MLTEEIRTFETLLPQLIDERRGQYALIHGSSVVGYFPTEHDALAAGYRQFGADAAFLVERIEPRHVVTVSSALLRRHSGGE